MNEWMTTLRGWGMEYIEILPPEKISLIVYNFEVYQISSEVRERKSGKLTNGTDMYRVVELLLHTFMMQK
jgi:hypothetical protein